MRVMQQNYSTFPTCEIWVCIFGNIQFHCPFCVQHYALHEWNKRLVCGNCHSFRKIVKTGHQTGQMPHFLSCVHCHSSGSPKLSDYTIHMVTGKFSITGHAVFHSTVGIRSGQILGIRKKNMNRDEGANFLSNMHPTGRSKWERGKLVQLSCPWKKTWHSDNLPVIKVVGFELCHVSFKMLNVALQHTPLYSNF